MQKTTKWKKDDSDFSPSSSSQKITNEANNQNKISHKKKNLNWVI